VPLVPLVEPVELPLPIVPVDPDEVVPLVPPLIVPEVPDCAVPLPLPLPLVVPAFCANAIPPAVRAPSAPTIASLFNIS
jgi:hypothetical protein